MNSTALQLHRPLPVFAPPPTAIVSAAAAGALFTRRALLGAITLFAANSLANNRADAESADGATASTLVKKPKKGQRGSKEAKGYQLCLSQCIYDCTTPRPGSAKTRGECRVECKDECAISREQL